MRKHSFLHKLRNEGKLELVDPSEEIFDSYIEKADNSLKSAKILLRNELYENSISMSYYAMYNSLLALLFKTGIKSENHTGSILAFQTLFDRADLARTISRAKGERIDTQYYVVSRERAGLTKTSARELLSDAETFLVQIKLIADKLKTEGIDQVRMAFKGLF